ncbi:MAG: hypothetical protein LAN64_14660 [Acidobacteriia bacterium]|nr:hypothetical protein [Terriglobia bacterium]
MRPNGWPCIVLVLALTLMCGPAGHAGGPLYVAGSGFNSGLAGKPLTWNNGQISYYTDQGDLSSILRQSAANAFVADAFSRWTSVSTAALSATRAGQLDQDVSGANVTLAGTVLTMPADIRPDSAKPFAIVYDADGKVIDALLGVGASNPQNCMSNGVIGGPDYFTDDAHIAHALLILNGNCIQTSAGLPLLRYSLVRMIGRSLGLDWSQLNDSVFLSPPPTSDDQAGFPVMHPQGSLCSLGDYGCVPNADQPRMDDRAAISRLYPVTAENLAPGKSVFSATTARVRGRVLFPGWNGAYGAGMQGVNVVARYINPTNGAPSGSAAASSVSGSLFRGNAGNAITGFTGATGERFDHWGSDDPALRGAYDLSGLEIPAGLNSAQFQITTEPINPLEAGVRSVGSYRISPVMPSGASTPVIVTVTRGGEVVQDLIMRGAAAAPSDIYEPHSFAAPGMIPGAGHWIAALSYYGDIDWYILTARAGRMFSFDATPRDESGANTTYKALPVIGLWAPGTVETAAPLLAKTWFNTHNATTRLLVAISSSGDYKLAITDGRGDGRPDFQYRARLLYADNVAPSHALPGTVLRITGIGFVPDMKVTIGAADATVFSYTVDELLVSAPTLADGLHDLTLTDSATGAFATITSAVTYGSGGDDKLQLLLGWNPPVPVGSQAPNPFRVRVVTADGTTPVAGASVTFTTPDATVSLLPCNTTSCLIATDATGEADVWMLVKAAGAATITAALSNGQTAAATVSGVVGPLQISAVPPKIYVVTGTNASVPLVAHVAGNGAPLPGRLVEFDVMLGAGTLTAATATTDSAGEARSTLTVTSLASEVRISACVGSAPETACDIFYVYPVSAPGGAQLFKAGGDGQYVAAGQRFAPVSVRVLDTNVVPNTLSGVAVRFRLTAYREQAGDSSQTAGEIVTGQHAQPVVLSSSDTTVYSDGWGQASLIPQFPAFRGALRIDIQASIPSGQTVTFTLHTLGDSSSTGERHVSPKSGADPQ